MKRSRKGVAEEHEEHIPESWLLPYADILTLLLALFIVLFASSEIDKDKFEAIMESFQYEFSGKEIVESDSPQGGITGLPQQQPAAVAIAEEEKELDKLRQKIENYIQENNLGDLVTLDDTPRGIEISFKDVILFDPGRAELKMDSYETLNAFIGLIQSVPNQISIEGHTDNVPIGTAPYRSNWELSSARAVSVLHYFASKGIVEERMQFTGHGEFQPVADNNTEANRLANRRVNIVILRNYDWGE